VPGGHVGIVVFVVRDFKDELIDICGVVVHLLASHDSTVKRSALAVGINRS
jgi:hypothetical protein